jgi:hypothetical protein
MVNFDALGHALTFHPALAVSLAEGSTEVV